MVGSLMTETAPMTATNRVLPPEIVKPSRRAAVALGQRGILLQAPKLGSV